MAIKHETKIVELAKLVPYEKNPNIHPQEQIAAMAKSMETYGQYYPILVDEDLKILCGHGKVIALQHLGKTEGEVRIMHGLTDKQKLRIVIEDNKIQSMRMLTTPRLRKSSGRLENSTSSALALTILMPS